MKALQASIHGYTNLPNYVGAGGFGGPNTVGGSTPQARNLMSGNAFANFGSAVASDPNTYFFQGNYTGTDRSGTVALGGSGVAEDGVAMVIGGTTAGAGNLISGGGGLGFDFPAGNSFTPDSNIVQGNLIGTDVTGTLALPNTTGFILSGGNSNLIGGTTPAARNVISGNANNGTLFTDFAELNTVQGNYIGVDISGQHPLGNHGAGISHTIFGNVANAVGTLIGGDTPGAGNVISSNNGAGLLLGGDGQTGIQGSSNFTPPATIAGNLIGTDATGTTAMGNGAAGISIFEGGTGYVIGGTDPAQQNIIAFNTGNGVLIWATRRATHLQAVSLGSAFSNRKRDLLRNSGKQASQVNSGSNNRVSQNSIFSNGGLGIGLGTQVPPLPVNGCQVNTSGPNLLQNAPVLTAAPGGATLVSATATDPNGNTSEFSNCAAMAGSGGIVNIVGTLNSLANTTYSLEFFSNSACDVSGFGQGKTFLNRISVTTNSSCTASFGDNANVNAADLSVSLSTNSFGQASVNSNFNYIAGITNNGSASATAVTFTDTLPAGVTFVSATGTQGTCGAVGNVVTCNVGTLPSGTTAAVTITVTAIAAGTISNTASVASSTADTNAANNSATANINSTYAPGIIVSFNPPSGVAGLGPINLNITAIDVISGTTQLFVNGTLTPYTSLPNQLNCQGTETCQVVSATLGTTLTASPGVLTILLTNPTTGGGAGGISLNFTIFPNTFGVTHFGITGIPDPALQNTPYNMVVTALNANNQVVPAYVGVVTLSGQFLGSPTFVPASPYTFTAGDAGVHTFTTTLLFPGSETITVADQGTPSVAGILSVTVNPVFGSALPASSRESAPDGNTSRSAFRFRRSVHRHRDRRQRQSASGHRCDFHRALHRRQRFIQQRSDLNHGQYRCEWQCFRYPDRQSDRRAIRDGCDSRFPDYAVFPHQHQRCTCAASRLWTRNDDQSQPINTQNGSLFDLKVTDAGGNALPSIPITLTVPSSGASINLSSTTIVSSAFNQGFVTVGEARLDPIGVANGTAGSYFVTATAGAASVQLNFTNTPVISTVTQLGSSGDGQSANVNTAFTNPLVVVPRDANFNCIAQIPVTFTAPSSGPSAMLSGHIVNSDPTTCVAQVTATANGVAGGPYTVTATVAGGPSAPPSRSRTARLRAPALPL